MQDVTQEEFFEFIDRHVFFCPIERDVCKFLANYRRREPNESFAVLKFKANSLLIDSFEAVKLSKYDSGSSPRFPNRCNYKKSLDMFIPLDQFGLLHDSLVPDKASEVREVLIKSKVANLTKYLEEIYCTSEQNIPDCWKSFFKPLKYLIKN